MNLPDAPIAHEGFFATHFFTVRDLGKSKDFYVRIFGGKVIKPENPCYIKLANTWIILNSGGGPTPDKPEVLLETPSNLNRVNEAHELSKRQSETGGPQEGKSLGIPMERGSAGRHHPAKTHRHWNAGRPADRVFRPGCRRSFVIFLESHPAFAQSTSFCTAGVPLRPIAPTTSPFTLMGNPPPHATTYSSTTALFRSFSN
jgi:hypothetical protein